MPSIVPISFPSRGYVMLEVNFADIPAATNVLVEAVNTATGERRALHAYISYDGNGYIALSCGQTVLYDTEPPCGTAMQYCATAISATGAVVTTTAAFLLLDAFGRTTASSWGAADTGGTYTNTGGAAADYSTTGSRGQHAVTTTGVLRASSLPMTTPNALARVTTYPAAVALTQSTEQFVYLRGDAAGANGYRARVRYNTGSTVDIILEKMVAGVATSLASSLSVISYVAATGVNVAFQAWGSTLSAKIWDITTTEPSAYQVTATDTTYTASGVFALGSIRSVGNTNGTVNFQWDNLSVADVCASPAAISACSENVTLACDGCFRLGDPLRPCNDVQVCMCYDGVSCGGTGGISGFGMTPDVYPADTGLVSPVNSDTPIPVIRNRHKATGTFTVTPTSFVARDALLALLKPGNTLLWRGPSEYGTGDRYIQITDVPVAPGLTDLRVQPRSVDLPFAVTRTPTGPSYGVCGTRFTDLCTTYASWDAMVAAGLTYADLLRGQAGSTPANLPSWNTVNGVYASWNALNAGQTSWTDTANGVP